MSRLLFEKTGDSIYISHLDLMRVFQRAFRRAGLLLRHSQGFTPRAIVSIALPHFELEQGSATAEALNAVLPAGIRVREVYEGGRKIKELTHLRARVTLEYDGEAPEASTVEALFRGETLVLEKQSKKGTAQVDILPMVRDLTVARPDGHTLVLEAVICAQNPSLNPLLLAQAVEVYASKPDFAFARRLEVLDAQGNVFR